jgi:hypothetical protein
MANQGKLLTYLGFQSLLWSAEISYIYIAYLDVKIACVRETLRIK